MRLVRWTACVAACALAASSIEGNASPTRKATFGAPSETPVIIEGMCSSDVRTQDACVAVCASAAHLLATGAGVKVAVCDGGFDLRHEFLAGHLGAQWDALGQTPYAQDLGDGIDEDGDGIVDDFVGHGTMTAGLVLACAPDATILPIRVLDDEGRGDDDALARGIDAAVALHADVINMSLVAPTTSQHLRASLDAAVAAGVVIVVAAGDDPAGPFNAQYVCDRSITVGAVDSTLHVAAFSPNSSMVNVFAPGVDVLGPLGGAVLNSYAVCSGTSFSAPFVSGAAALVRQTHPTLGLSGMRALLAASVDPVVGAVPSTSGSIDLLDAASAQ